MQTFSDRVIKIALSIPKGRVTTYGRIARAAGAGSWLPKGGNPRSELSLFKSTPKGVFKNANSGIAAQSITTILGKAYDNGIKNIPFHRIVYADGHIWVSPSHRKERLALYKKEKIELDTNDKIKNFRDILIEFT
jgi:alkylated DNA nucleotide flippase Atl1